MTAETATPRPRWYWLYFALAAFDLMTVSFSLYLNHRLTQSYSASIRVNETWATRLGTYSALRDLASKVNAPGNDVFDSQAVDEEAQRMKQALAAFDGKLDHARQELSSETAIAQITGLLDEFRQVRKSMDEMVAEADLIFNFFRNRQPREAGERMATMDRKYARLNQAFSRLEEGVREIQRRRFASQHELAQQLQRAEYAIVAGIVLMILGVTWYGSKVMREMTNATRAREQLLAELQQARDELDQRVEQRTAALLRTTQDLNEQIAERVAAENQLRDSERRLRQIIDLVPHYIFAKDSAGQFVLANQAVAQAYGTTVQELEGKSYADFAASDAELQRAHQSDMEVLESGRAKTTDNEIITDTNGVEHVLSTVKIPFTFSGTERPAVLGVSTDITERNRAQQALQRLNDELEERVRQRTAALVMANKELEAFSYSVSHDLRSPLRGIDGWSQVLLEDYAGKLDDTGKSHLNRVRAEARRMSELIDSMLELSRVMRADLRRETVNLSRMADDLVSTLRQRQPERTVEVVIEPEMTAQGDARLLRQVLQNLLENAWKFTAKRSDARIAFDTARGVDGIVYRITDNGAGFDMAYAGKLFGAFQRLHKATEFPGTGVGLATVQRIIHRHGGKIWADSKVGEGTTFQFTIEESA